MDTSITQQILEFLSRGGTGISLVFILCWFIIHPLIEALANKNKEK